MKGELVSAPVKNALNCDSDSTFKAFPSQVVMILFVLH